MCLGFFGGLESIAEIHPEKVYTADSKKTNSSTDGMMIGGHRDISSFVVKEIRHASQPKFERIVIQLEPTLQGEKSSLPHPPYYQASLFADEHRALLALWGQVTLEADFKKSSASLRTHSLVQSFLFFPPELDPNIWVLELQLSAQVKKFEVFELEKPTRIILDFLR